MKTYCILFFINLHTHTHTHWNAVGKRITILSKLVTEINHCLKQSILASSAKTQTTTI